MGLDMYIFKADKTSYDKMKSLKNAIEELECDFRLKNKDDVNEYYRNFNSIKNDYYQQKMDNDTYSAKITELENGFRMKHKDYFDKIESLEGEISSVDDRRQEIAYWRKFWLLHGYLSNVLDGVDNTEDSVISKENCQEIIDDLTAAIKTGRIEIIGNVSDNSCLNDDIWTELKKTTGIFKGILENYDENCVYFYHPWW